MNMGPKRQSELALPNEEPKPAEVVEIHHPAAIIPTAPTPATVLLEAHQRGASIETLTKLLELQERWEANEARKAFARDLAAFKAEAPKLEKVKEVDFTSKSGTRVHFKYAPLDYTCEKLAPVLSRHNLSHNWDVDQTNGDKVRVTCLLEHSLGHIKRVAMESPILDDQRMNALQRLRATVSMLQRYTLESVTGTASSDVDAEFEGVTMDQAADFLALIREAENLQELDRHYKDAIKAALGNQISPKASGNAISLYKDARSRREAELRK